MSMIHAALKKAEEERKNKEPYHLSIDAIVELAKGKKRPEDLKTSVSAASFSRPVKQIKLRRPATGLNLPVKGIFLALAVVLLIWLAASICGPLFFRHPAVPSQGSHRADGLKNIMAKKVAAVPPAVPEKSRPLQASPLGNFILTGVVTSDGHWSAMINGKLAEVGSIVYGANVVSIYEGAATLEKNGKRFTIYLD